MNLGTYNVRTLNSEAALSFLFDELHNIKIDIVAVCETRRRKDMSVKWNDGSEVMLGAAKNGVGGVGFIVLPSVTSRIISMEIVSHRLAILKLRIGKSSTMKVVAVYAPTSAASDDEIEEFYEELHRHLRQKSTYTLVLGDFNAKLGSGHSEDTFIGKFGYGARNERGQRLADFAECTKLYVMNTFFQKRPGRRWTWRAPNDRTRNEIDFVLCDKKRIVKDVSVIAESKVCVHSDHRLIRAKVVVDLREERRRLARASQRRKPQQFSEALFTRAVENTDWSMCVEDIDEDYGSILEKLQKCRSLATVRREGQCRKRLTEATLQMLSDRRKMANAGNTGLEYKILCKELRRRMADDYENFRKERLRKAAEDRASLKKAWREVQVCRKMPTALVNEQGRRTTVRKEMEEICQNYFNALFASTKSIAPPSIERIERVPEVLSAEIEKAVRQMKPGKAVGPDETRAEEIRAGGEVLAKALSIRFTKYINTGRIPEQWKHARTVLIPKKGDREDIRNYRPITLLSHLYKIFMRVIYARMERTLDDNMPREQAGFRRRFSTIDHIFTISQLTERCREYKLPLCLLFVDFEKAFDSVEHNAVLRAMTDQGVEAAYVRILQETMRESHTEITLFERPLKIYMKRGVKQGDICSPKAFTCALQSVMRQVAEKDGFEIDGETLQMLLFADDVVLIASKPETLQSLLNEMCHLTESIGLKIHPGKTKWMKNAHCDDFEIKLNNQLVERVEHYVYLGQAIRMDNDLRLELSRRRKAGWTAFSKIDVLLKNKDIPAQTKSQLFHSSVLPALLYGCETWNLTKAEERSLQVTQRAMERQMLGISRGKNRGQGTSPE
ncbi:hypothetical protein Y032_0018g3494 [Ancylostoma ceylanicum]|uniref:Reverse transcriptase domain-containing protein n=1 Tax=Ancylostoma ceylanicum TaxID=53326 RepID=A0A016V4Q8_9BILA|nr:hypothetical protein Y032_0018g3494 [Ancylostoma ceylanicum]